MQSRNNTKFNCQLKNLMGEKVQVILVLVDKLSLYWYNYQFKTFLWESDYINSAEYSVKNPPQNLIKKDK